MSPKTKKNHLGKVGKPRMAVRRAMPFSFVSAGNTRSSASGEHGHGAGTADDGSTGLVEQARTKSPTPRGMDRRHSRRAPGASKARSKGSHKREALVKKKMGSQKAQRQAALTGDLAPFPTLSR